MGVLLRVCEQDPGSETRPLAGMEPVRVLRELRFGGLVDTRTRRIVGPSRRPVIWWAGPEQVEQILPRADAPPRQLVFGAEGAGKTRVLSKWTILQALRITGMAGTIGVTAPINRRLRAAREALRADMPAEWYREIKSEGLILLANGVQLLLLSTFDHSEKSGSPLQSYTFAACASDELQDSVHVDGDIETRGRGAPGGRYRRLCTATAKDSPEWRSLMAEKRALDELWSVSHLPGLTNPFVSPAHWENLRRTLSPREYRRRVLAQDVGPERMLYHTWDRERNVRPIPRGSKDVTASVLRRFGARRTMLIGYDPGKLYDVAILIRAYLPPRAKLHAWWVIAEFVMEQSTTHSFAAALRTHLRERYELMESDTEYEIAPWAQLPQIIADPASDNNETQPDEQVYRVFKQLGFPIRPAAWSKSNPVKHGRIPKESRIETLCNLMLTAAGETRFHVDTDERGRPVAPRFVTAVETQERGADGKAEQQKKDRRDMSHYTAAGGYAVYPIERTLTVAAVADYEQAA